METLDIEQVQTLREHLKGHHLEAIITLALVTGMRRDELLSLKWQDVDMEKGELRFQDVKTRDLESLDIPEDVVLLLKEHKSDQTKEQEAAGLTWVNLDLVFPDHGGSPLDPHQLMKDFHNVLEQAGLPRISFHDLRHTVAQSLYNTQKTKGA